MEGRCAGDTAGAVISPVLANIYLHYVLDLRSRKRWRVRKKRVRKQPETFDFRRFTHHCAERQGRGASVWDANRQKRMSQTPERIGEILRRRTNDKVSKIADWLGNVARGRLGYHAVTISYKYAYLPTKKNVA